MQDPDHTPLSIISEQILDEELRSKVLCLASQLTPYPLVQAELVSIAMDYLAQHDQNALSIEIAYEAIFHRMLNRVRAVLLNKDS